MFKGYINKILLGVSSGLTLVLLLGSGAWIAKEKGWLKVETAFSLTSELFDTEVFEPDPSEASQSAVLPLFDLAAEERVTQLEALSEGDNLGDRLRARYLLASDWIDQYEGGKAIRLLKGLENQYPVLAPQILIKRARGYELTNELGKSQEILLRLTEDYPDSPLIAEAYYQLGKSQPEYGEKLITDYPKHPRTHQLIRDRLQENPQQPQLLLILAHYTPDEPNMSGIRDRLVTTYGEQLTPEDWEAIAFGYWQQREYGKAGQAYAKAPKTPKNSYRAARGLQLDDRKEEAKIAYQSLIQTFPDDPETGLGLRRLADLSSRQDALGYLDQVIGKFPQEAPAALLKKAKLLEAMGSGQSAGQTRQTLLTQYRNADATAEYRWGLAQRLAAQGNLEDAWTWAGAIPTYNPKNSLAPKAAFWVGKWATQLNRNQEAQDAFEHVLRHHPQSYWAWRSANMLGLDVGDFTTVRARTPEVIQPTLRPIPPVGSPLFKELYQLGEDYDAWKLWQAEIAGKQELSVPEQFTDGLLKLTQGKHLKGINQVWFLGQREDPEEIEQWQTLREQPEYWYALFPFPFQETILKWSQERQLNPLLVTALIRQESRFEPEIASFAGATGLMQLMPGTAKETAQNVGLQDYSLINVDHNVNLGTWYLDFTHQEYQQNSLLAIASYNAGPGNVAKWLKQYGWNDPDRFVEQIPFRETKGYVETVFENYWNYLRLYNPEVNQKLSEYQ